MVSHQIGSASLLRQVALAACLFFFAIHASGADAAPTRPAPYFVQSGKVDQAEGRKVLEDFRKRGLGNGFFTFEFRFMPRKGEERIVPGRMWLGATDAGTASRTELFPGDPAQEQRLLVQNGASGHVWSWRPQDGIAVAPVAPSGLLDPISGTNFSPFDLQMPYLFWNDWVYEGVAKHKGRLADVFLLYPPVGFSAEIRAVRVYIDTQFHALVQSECIGEGATITKVLQVVDFKKVDDQWIIKVIDLRNEKTRDKTRFQVTGAAMGETPPEGAFDEGALASSLLLLPSGRIRSIIP